MGRRSQGRAFTLVELLVVIGLILLLAGLLFPMLGRAQMKGRQTHCLNNLHQISLGLSTYRQEHEDKAPGWLSNLYPDYVDDPSKPYLCISDHSRGVEGSKPDATGSPVSVDHFAETDDTESNTATGRNAAVSRCSYLYEFCAAACSWCDTDAKRAYLGAESGTPAKAAVDSNGDGVISWSEAKYYQLERGDKSPHGPYNWTSFPIVRCFHHYDEQNYLVAGGTNMGMTMNVSYAGNIFTAPLKWEMTAH